MGERILDQIEHLAVEFGLGALHFQVDLLAEFVGQIAHDARQLLPGIADRLHARLHDAFLQLGGDVGQPLQRRLEFRILVAAHDLEQLIAREHQLRHHGHQLFERIDGDADRLVGGLGGVVVLGRGSAGAGLAGFGGGRIDRGFAERALEIVERILARPQRPFQHLRRERADRVLRRRGAATARRCSTMRSRSEIRSSSAPSGSRCSRSSDSRICLMRSMVARIERDGVAGRRHAVAKLAHQRLGGMRQRFQPRQIRGSRRCP